MSYTTADLITSIKTRGMIPSSQSTFDDTKFLSLATEEIALGLLPLLLSVREEYLVTHKDFAPAIAVDIPYRAVGMKVRSVMLVNPQGDERRVAQIDPDDTIFYPTSTQDPKFYLRANQIIFTTLPVDTIRVYYFLTPSQLVPTTSAAQITSINKTTGEVDVSTAPTTFLTSTPLDFVRANPGYDVLGMDVLPTSIVGTSLTFTPSTIPSGLQVGDWIALAGQSPVVQLPQELLPILAQRVTVKVLEALGDVQGVQIAEAKLGKMEQAAFKLLEPRVDGSPRKIINRNSSLRVPRIRWWF